MKKMTIVIGAIFSALQADAQESGPFKIAGYLETYYAYDFNKPSDHNRPGFIYSHNRHNEVNLNLGFIKASFNKDMMRANLAFMAGTYTNANLAAEPEVLRNIYESNIGLKLSGGINLWLDAGILPSHIGFESAVSKDCWTLTRNISSDNTPYYETGVRISYISSNNKWSLSGLYLNGWQRITRQEGSQKPAGGLQITYKPTESITLNYSNYLGAEGADTVGVRRFYNNLYVIFSATDQLRFTLGFDYGLQQQRIGSNESYKIYSPVAIARYQVNAKWAVTGRTEYYDDENSVIIPTASGDGFKTFGHSLNIDYSPVSNALVRVEGKIYDSKNRLFIRKGNAVNQNATVTASIAVAF